MLSTSLLWLTTMVIMSTSLLGWVVSSLLSLVEALVNFSRLPGILLCFLNINMLIFPVVSFLVSRFFIFPLFGQRGSACHGCSHVCIVSLVTFSLCSRSTSSAIQTHIVVDCIPICNRFLIGMSKIRFCGFFPHLLLSFVQALHLFSNPFQLLLSCRFYLLPVDSFIS